MKGNHQNHGRLPGPLRCAAVSFVIWVWSMLFAMPAWTQPDTLNVPSDVPPGEGNLNKAVQAAITAGTLSNTVFKLEPYGYYILTSTITVPAGEHLTIIAPEPGRTQETAPPQIVWSSNIELFKYSFNFECYGAITMKNVWLLYANTEGQQIGANIQIRDDSLANASGRGEVVEFDGVIFDYSCIPPNASGAVGVSAKHFKGTFKNCYFRNCTDPHWRYYGRAVSFPFGSTGWHIDSLAFENCTFANLGYVYMQEGGEYGDNIHFNHCTFLNVVMFTLQSGWWYKMSVTNSIFVNTHMYGNMPAYAGNDPFGGTIRIDSVASFGFEVPFSDQDRRILFANSSYFIEKWLRDWMHDNPESVYRRMHGEPEFVPEPQPMLSPGTLRFFDVTENGTKVFPLMNRASLYDSANPGFVLTPSDTAALKQFLYFRWCCSADFAWAYHPELSVQRVWPLRENLAYTNTTLVTAGMGGFPLGDLYRWFPDKYAQWQSQKEAENARIFAWLNTGKDPGTVGVREQTSGAVPLRFTLGQNYPNPFNPTTQISYAVPQNIYISVKVYNHFGQEVATLVEGVRQPGEYLVTFDASGFASGVYFYQLRAKDFVETRKFLLLK